MSKIGTRILVVEDEPGIAELLRFALSSHDYECDIASTAEIAQKYVDAMLPQLVLLDWMLPDRSGLSLLLQWRATARTADLPVIMLTAKGVEEDKIKGLNAGADDYVTKPFSPKELIARIQALLRRKVPEVGRTVMQYGPIFLDAVRHEVTVDGQVIVLDQSEYKLLRYFLAHPERIFSRAQLLDKVWGDHTFIEERTVDVHIMRLRKALKAAAPCIATVRGLGYKLSTG